MKKLLTFSLAVILCANMFSQPPSKISYQSVVRTSDNNLITNQQVGICISILQGSETGLEVYKEIYYPNPQTNFNGLVTIEIGTGIPLKGDFSTVDWSNGPYYLRTEIDPTGGTIYTISGTSQLLSVPYSLYAKTSESISGEIPETDPIFSTWDKSTGISITESQINDLGNYIESETDPVFTAWDKSSDIIISEVQITDLQNYLVSESDPAVTANFDFTDAATGDLLQFNGERWVKLTPQYISGYTVTETDVTAHQEALIIKESQISDLKNYLTQETQTIADVAALNNSVNAQIKNVTDPTDAQDAATKNYVDALLLRIEALEEANLLANGFKDERDNYTYPAVKIGEQIWMAENLRYLPSVVGPVTGSQTDPYYYVYDYDGTVVNDAKATLNYEIYGVLYNWAAAMNGESSSSTNPSGVQGICPTGWHLPSDAEWTQLANYLGGTSIAGGKLKETGTTHWNSPNTDATNETGFTALPAGNRSTTNTFFSMGDYSYWWSSTQMSTTAYYHLVYNTSGELKRMNNNKAIGFSVRCIKD